jgi:inhibitor of cysteine peptidase
MSRRKLLLWLSVLSLLAMLLAACSLSPAALAPASPDALHPRPTPVTPTLMPTEPPPPTRVVTRTPAATPNQPPSSGTEIWLTEVNAGERVQVSTGQVLGINLEANPSTGYLWEVSAINPNILQQTGEPEFKSDSKLVGAPARQLIRFNVVAPGESRLELVYHRPWEKDRPPARSFSVTVSAQ